MVKNFKKKIVISLLLLTLFLNITFSMNYLSGQHESTDENVSESLRTNQSELPDKVFTFFAPYTVQTFEDLYLQGSYMYFIWIELVSQHDVSNMGIRIWDPENIQYDIFESDMYWEPEYGRYFEIPFGTALAGNYTIEFSVITSKNVNILIRMEQGPKCLHDKLDWQDIDKIIFYDVRRFHNNMYVEHFIQLQTDTMYKFYFGRVSAISIKEDNDVIVDINITDAHGTEFEIFNNLLLYNVDELNGFCFGTANGGNYTLKLRVYCQVNYINLALAVIKDYTIGGANDTNQPPPQPIPDNNTNTGNVTYYIPNKYKVGMIIFVGLICGIPTLIVVYHKKKNTAGFKFRLKRSK